MSIKMPTAGMLLLAVASQAAAAERCEVRSSATITPLVELYTSEGCSSCPPADRWFSKQLPGSQGNWLAFHVDYWDDIGWPDRFSSHDYTVRQRTRVSSVGKDAIFTPQVMLGSDVQAPWQSGGRFDRALKDASQTAPVALALQAQPQGKAWDVRLGVAHIQGVAFKPAQVWLAQYVDGQVTNVRAGENRGVTLHHDRVVRKLYGPWKLGAESLSQSVVVAPQAGSWGMTAFVQDGSGNILQSLNLPAAATCASSGTASL